jgi:hypothetical protein
LADRQAEDDKSSKEVRREFADAIGILRAQVSNEEMNAGLTDDGAKIPHNNDQAAIPTELPTIEEYVTERPTIGEYGAENSEPDNPQVVLTPGFGDRWTLWPELGDRIGTTISNIRAFWE